MHFGSVRIVNYFEDDWRSSPKHFEVLQSSGYMPLQTSRGDYLLDLIGEDLEKEEYENELDLIMKILHRQVMRLENFRNA